MKLSAATLCLSVASGLVASSFVVGRTEASKTSKDPYPIEEASNIAALEGSPTDKVHKFPSIFFFEVRKNFADDAEIMAEVEEAFILSANEAHDTTKMYFESARIKKVRHEKIEGLGEVMEDDPESPVVSPSIREVAEPSDALEYRYYYGRQYRINYSNTIGVGCNFCTLDDDNYLGSSFLDSGYYQTIEGSEVLQNWENLFCKRLASIKKLKKPTRCYIDVDFDHEETDDDDEDFVMSTDILKAD